MSSNPLLESLKLPGRIFQLPSQGIFYKNGELDESIKDGEIHVHPMSAIDEINMKNPDQLFSGAAVETVFSRCIPGIKKPAQLMAKDIDAIMLFLRAVTYGSSYEFSAKHGCADAKEHSYVADVDQLINQMRVVDPTTIDQLYTINLTNGQVVQLRPNRYQDVLDLIKLNEAKTTITFDDQQANLTKMLVGVVESVNGITDEAQITEWSKALPAPMVNRIADKIDGVNDWGSSLKWKCVCRDCGEDFEVELPINPVSFFTE